VKRDTIHVNDPMSYDGIRFFQSFFGQTAVMEVKNEAGDVLSATLFPRLADAAMEIARRQLCPARERPERIRHRSSLRRERPMVPAGEMRVEVYTRTAARWRRWKTSCRVSKRRWRV
jgi:hypothetical protein